MLLNMERAQKMSTSKEQNLNAPQEKTLLNMDKVIEYQLGEANFFFLGHKSKYHAHSVSASKGQLSMCQKNRRYPTRASHTMPTSKGGKSWCATRKTLRNMDNVIECQLGEAKLFGPQEQTNTMPIACQLPRGNSLCATRCQPPRSQSLCATRTDDF